MKQIFSKSEHFKAEYACELVRIGEILPIEGADAIAKTEIKPNMPIVVRKDDVHTGDLMFYADMETQLCDDFLRINDEYCHPEMNANPNAEHHGFFERNGRIRMIKLRGQVSMGYLFSLDAMQNYLHSKGIEIPYFNDEIHVGDTFDMVGGEQFIQAYIPAPKQQPAIAKDRAKKRNKKLKRFDRLVPGEFSFHYDTAQLEKNAFRLEPDQVVDLTVKIHGTSAIFGNILVNRELSFWEKVKKFFGADIPLTEYGNVYSSRSVIKNQYINKDVTPGFYNEDVWAHWNNLIKDFIPRGTTIYGEIVGFLPSGGPIQKNYDYGCGPRESQLMIYRVNAYDVTEDKHIEANIEGVITWTKLFKQILINNGLQDVANHIRVIDQVYHGTLAELYPDISTENLDAWRAEVIRRLAIDKRFGMEENEPFCANKVPREGLVLRIENDPLKEAFKIKTFAYRNREAMAIDAGEVDMEMEGAYTNPEE